MNYQAFRKVTELQNEFNVCSLPIDTSAFIQEHLVELEASLKKYFPPINTNRAWIRNPFSVNLEFETNLLDL